jgi:YihY family inner membrane protein
VKQLQKVINRVDSWQQRHHFTAFTYAVIKKYGEDNAGLQAALLTYYGFLSLFPLLLVVTTIANNTLGSHPHAEQTVISGLTNYFPTLGNQLADRIHALHKSGLALAVGILFTLYGTHGVADVFQRGVRRIWGEKQSGPGFPVGTLKSIGLVVVGGLGFVVASITAGLAAAAGHGWEFRSLAALVNLFILFWLFVFLLNASLPRHVTLKEIRVGAICAAVGLVILQLLGGIILRHELKSLDALYSTFAIPLGLLFWIYLQAQTLYYSAVIAVVSSKKQWPRGFSENGTNS